MKLKTFVKHCIMQNPGLFHNALEVYNHLFYVIGNGYEWKNGVLYNPWFRTIPKMECVSSVVKQHTKYAEKMCSIFSRKTKSKLIREKYENEKMDIIQCVCNDIHEEIERIKYADVLSENFVPRKGFKFYPISKHSLCMQIPDDIQSDWLEGINMINNFRKQHPELE